MPQIHKKHRSPLWVVLILIMGLGDLVLIIRKFLIGNNTALFNPKGLIASEQHKLMLLTAGIMLVVAVPAVFLLYFTAWKYRETNTKATYNPDIKHGKRLNAVVWGVPLITMLILASIMIPATHRLAPAKSIASDAKPLTIQVISLRWKWLFIYPEQNIATINYVQIPVNTPVQFELTADDAPMSSFWIPNLGGQLYSMTGHVNRLNLMADEAGDYPGSTAELNGEGFAGMKFVAHASSAEDFETWTQGVKQSPNALDAAAYEKILEPSENETPALFSSYDSSLYAKVVMKYTGPSGGSHHE